MIFEEYCARKREIKDEARRKRAELDQAWMEAGGDLSPDEISVHPSKDNTIFAEAIDVIRHTPKGQHFDINTLSEAIIAQHPERAPLNPTTISGICRKLAVVGYVRLATPGRGNRPAEYRKVASR